MHMMDSNANQLLHAMGIFPPDISQDTSFHPCTFLVGSVTPSFSRSTWWRDLSGCWHDNTYLLFSKFKRQPSAELWNQISQEIRASMWKPHGKKSQVHASSLPLPPVDRRFPRSRVLPVLSAAPPGTHVTVTRLLRWARWCGSIVGSAPSRLQHAFRLTLTWRRKVPAPEATCECGVELRLTAPPVPRPVPLLATSASFLPKPSVGRHI
jgi:hypothetical protein